VTGVYKDTDNFLLKTSDGDYTAKAIVSATGSFLNPFSPEVEGAEQFLGTILHSSQYISPEEFKGKRVAIVGEGNSGAQILSEVSKVTSTIWITRKEPKFLPDHVDGRYLFDAASQMYQARLQGKAYQPPSLGNVVMVDPVKEARERGALEHSLRPFQRFSSDGLVWQDGREEKVDAVIYCTGFKASLEHLYPAITVNGEGRLHTSQTRATTMEGLWLVGYGNWTGFASATLIGVGRSAKTTVEEIVQYLIVTKESAPVL
jgi:putative flavoprotein involved in K+ transport